MNQTPQHGSIPAAVELYASRVAIHSTNGNHIRTVPAALAAALVTGGTARPASTRGRVRAVVLVRTASTSAVRIGDASDGRASGVRFTRWVHLDAYRIIEHHPRCTYE